MAKKVLAVLVVTATHAFGGTVNLMPEPSAVPELLLGLAGVACLVWFISRKGRTI